MKLFVVLFCIALMLNGFECKKKTKEEIEAEKKAKEEEKIAKQEHNVKIEIKLINQRMEMMQKTIDTTWVMDDWVPTADNEELRALADENHEHPDEFQSIMNDAIEKIDGVLGEQKQVEEDSKSAFDSHRGERSDETELMGAIQSLIDNANLSEKKPIEIKALHKRLIRIHDEFKGYAAIVKMGEEAIVKKMFKNMVAIQAGIYDLCEKARKIIYDHKRFSAKELEKIKAAADKKIIEPLDQGLNFKNKDLALSKMRDANESAYRPSYERVKKIINEIDKTLNKKGKEEEEAEAEE